jgi:hypothetical protein
MKHLLLLILVAIVLSIFLATISRAAEKRILTVNCFPKDEVIANVRAVEGKLRVLAIDVYGRGVLVYIAESGLFTIGFVPEDRDDLICPIFWGVESAFVEETGEER